MIDNIDFASVVKKDLDRFNKSRAVKMFNQIKSENPEKWNDTDKRKEKIKEIFEHIRLDEDSTSHEKHLEEVYSKKYKNFNILRNEINDLNDLTEFSVDVEKNNIQRIDNFLSYEELMNQSLNNVNHFLSVIDKKRKMIDKYIQKFKDLKLNFARKYSKIFNENDSLQILLYMRDLYKIKHGIDDIELYDKYDMIDNLTMSNMLSDICYKMSSENQNRNNLLNELLKKNNTIGKITSNITINNNLLGTLLRTNNIEYDEDENFKFFVSNNKVTCFHNTYVTDATNERIYTRRTLGELLFEITNDEAEYVDKSDRRQIYMTYDGERPTTEEYYKWNGLQVFDIDLKNWVNESGNSIEILKKRIFEYLTDFHWFLWICKSSSGKGIHIYTKVAPPHHVYTNPKDNEYISEYWYKVNYYTKASIIYDCLYRLRTNFKFTENFFVDTTEDSKYTSGFELKNLDNSVGRITSGIRLTYDPQILVNNNFIDLHVGYNISQTLDGYDYKSTINKILFRNTVISKNFFEQFESYVIKDLKQVENKKESFQIDFTKYAIKGYDLTDVKILPRDSINYNLRYNVCNTLASIFGKDGLQIAHDILRSDECKNVKEIDAFYASAIRNKKEPTKYGLDILKRCGIIKTIEKELKEFTESNFKSYIRKSINNSLESVNIQYDIILENNEYIGDKEDYIIRTGPKILTNDKINIIFSPPNTGKTEFIKRLARKKRVMLVLPFISVIKNKIETDKEIMQLFECYYGNKSINDLEYGINTVTTFDKFSRCNYEKISRMYDYIFIDECHLLFTSSYRIEATSNAIKKIKSLYYISQNDAFSAKLCLTTGTETGERYFFGDVANTISIHKKLLTKNMEFQIGDDLLDCITRMSYKIADLIKKGYRILIPTNKGEIYSEKIIGMVQYLLKRDVLYGYYKRSNTEQEICALINEKNTVGNYEIIFCSNYLSVGVDINDKDVKFASMYIGNFSAYEIEQFNSRIRKKEIESTYFIQTQKSNGETNDLLLEEPNLVLRLTDEDIINFNDDKAIASAKQEFIAQYDPMLQKIVTPGFSYIAGQIKFNLEEYELINFENKYNECYQHPLKISRELYKYGYNVSVDAEFESLPITVQEELQEVGVESARQEKIKKHNIIVGTFIDLIKGNRYQNQYGLEYNNVIDWIGRNNDAIFEDRNMENFVVIEYDVFASPTKCIVKSKEALDAMFKPAKYLASKYSTTKCIDIIMNYVDDNGILKQKSFKRAINLLKLIDSSDANELAEPVTKILEKIYDFIDSFQLKSDYRISYNSYVSFIESLTNNYIDLLGIKIQSKYGFDKLQDSVIEMLNDVGVKTHSKKGIRFDYNKLPDQNSSEILNRRSVDTMVEKLFRITSEVVVKNNKISAREKHIVLDKQPY